MSDYGSVDEIQRKIRDGLFSAFENELSLSLLFNFYLTYYFISCDSS